MMLTPSFSADILVPSGSQSRKRQHIHTSQPPKRLCVREKGRKGRGSERPQGVSGRRVRKGRPIKRIGGNVRKKMT